MSEPKVPAERDSVQDEREAFEAWAESNDYTAFERVSAGAPREGEYRNSHMHYLWTAWQARAALSRPTPAALTDEQIDRHTLEAKECPPGSKVMLVSSIKRLLERS